MAAEETHLKAESPEVKPSSRRPSDAITVGGASRSAALPGVIAPPVLASQNGGSRLLGLLSEKPTPLPRLDTSSAANVEAVDSVGDALQRLPLFIPDVLLSDIGLPIESGYDLIRKVRSLPTNLNKVPAVALTAFATEADRKMSLTAGFQAHLAKPVEPGHLVHTIKGLINGHS